MTSLGGLVLLGRDTFVFLEQELSNFLLISSSIGGMQFSGTSDDRRAFRCGVAVACEIDSIAVASILYFELRSRHALFVRFPETGPKGYRFTGIAIGNRYSLARVLLC